MWSSPSRSTSLDLGCEILRWHCVNSSFLSDQLHTISDIFTHLGRIPMRCSHCATLSRTRQMYRCMAGVPMGVRTARWLAIRTGQPSINRICSYLCCFCALQETRLFLTSPSPFPFLTRIIRAGSNNPSRELANILVGILSRMEVPRGDFVAECSRLLRFYTQQFS